MSIRVSHALLDTYSIVELLHQHYLIAGKVTCVLEKSAPNPVYHIATQKGRFALKIYSSHKPFEFEHEYLQFLLRQGVNVAKPISTLLGAPFFSTYVCGYGIYGVLHEYIKGRDLAHGNPADAQAYGQELGRLHRASLEFSPSTDSPVFDSVGSLHASMDCIAEILSDLEHFERIDHYRNAAENLEVKLKEFNSRWANSSYIHGDTHGGNAKAHRGKIYFFDFELACLGPIEWDLACFKWASKVGKREESYLHFLCGYRKSFSKQCHSEEMVSCLSLLKEFEVVSNQLKMSKILGSWFVTERYLEMRLSALRSGM